MKLREAVGKIDKEFIKICQEVDRFYSVSSELFTPAKYGRKIIQNIENLKNFALSLSTKNEMEELMIANLVERLELIKLRLKLKIEGISGYKSAIKMYGLSGEDIDAIKKKFESMNVRKVVEDYIEKTKLSRSSVSDESEIKRTRKILNKILKICYQISPARKYFRSFKSYLDTVTFREKGSYHILGGKVVFGIKDFEIVWYYEGNKLIEDVDIFWMVKIVGEEALLGHQGNNIITDKAKIPRFMKIDTGCRVPVEIIGGLGSLILTEKIKDNAEIRKLIRSKDIFNFLLQERELIFKNIFINNFLHCYRDYLKEIENKSFKEISNILFRYTGDKYFKSEFFRRYFNSFYNNKFLENIEKRAENWVYLYRNIKAEEIFKKLKRLSEKEAFEILEKLYVGYWPKKTFERYVDFVFNNYIL